MNNKRLRYFNLWVSLIILVIICIPAVPVGAARSNENNAVLQMMYITPESLGQGEVKVPYSEQLHVVNGSGPFTWTLKKGSKLPSGLTFKTDKSDTSKAAISGKPGKAGTFSLTVQATDSTKASAEKIFTILINPVIKISTPALPKIEVGAAFPTWTPAATGGNGVYDWEYTGAFPAGLDFNSSTGMISGTPNESGVFPVTLTVKDTLGGSAGKKLSLKVLEGIAITTLTLPSGDPGVTYKTTTLVAAGGTKKYTWTIIDGALPAGLSFSTSGSLKGKPAAGSSGVYALTIQVEDKLGKTTRDFEITIYNPMVIGPLPDGVVNQVYSHMLTATGGSGGYKYAKVGTWPKWLKLDSKTNTLSGTPAAAGLYPIRIKITDSLKCSVTQSMDLEITDNSIDTTRPTVISVAPAAGTTHVATNTIVKATFSEAMKESSITTASFLLNKGVTPVNGTVIYSSAGESATFTPSENLDMNTLYTATVTTVVQDQAGNNMANNCSWNFTTLTPANIQAVGPEDSAAGVTLNTNVYAKFSRKMNQDSIDTNSFILKKGNIPVSGHLEYDEVNEAAILLPDANLEPDTGYTAVLTTDVLDKDGNAIPEERSWSFTTGENITRVYIDPVSPTVAADSTFTVDVKIASVNNLRAGQLQIKFDDTLIQLDESQYENAVEDGLVGSVPFSVTARIFYNSSGLAAGLIAVDTIRIILENAQKSADGDGYLVRLHFKALGTAGTSPLVFDDQATGREFHKDLFDNQGVLISAEWQDGAVTVTSP
jgi:hypothetical protein